MNGIDIAGWQAGIDLSKVPCDFVICKATGGRGYKNPDFKRQADQTLAQGKLLGVYHFAKDGYSASTPKVEADFFLKTAAPYIGKAILVLDWEADAVALGAGWAEQWLDYVKGQTGVTPMLYSYYGQASGKQWASVAKKYPLWVAQYAISTDPNAKPGYTAVHGYMADPPGEKSVGHWGTDVKIRQYTSQGYLDGWKSNLDLDLAYIDEAEWERMCKAEDAPTDQPVSTDRTINVTETAREVIAGKYGNGLIRRNRLGKLFADAVQDEVNRILGG